MIKFIKYIFRIKKREEKIIEKLDKRENIVSPDFIDYDGMGNQGRFPKRRRSYIDKNR